MAGRALADLVKRDGTGGHTDLRLADLSVQMDALREKLDQMQRILEEVE
jgi:hypothetical protein